MSRELPMLHGPVACSLDARDLAARGEEMNALFTRGDAVAEPTDGGARFTFTATDGLASAVDDIVRKESACCPFFDFHVSRDDRRLVLDVRGPAEARPLIDAMMAIAARPRAGNDAVEAS